MFAKKSSHFCAQLCTLYYRGQVHMHMPTSCAFLNDFTLLPFSFQIYSCIKKKKKVVLIKSIKSLFMEACSCNKSLFLSLLNISVTRVWKRSKGKGDKHKSDVRDSACGSAQMLHTKMRPLTVDAVQANHGIFLSSFTWQREGRKWSLTWLWKPALMSLSCSLTFPWLWGRCSWCQSLS